MAYVIDSSAFIALERRRRDLLQWIDTLSTPAALTTVTLSELLVGAHRADSLQRRLQREEFVAVILNAVKLLPFDLRAARIHAQIWAELAVAGQMIGAHDLLIAATALAHGYDVLTLNARHFRPVPGLIVHIPPFD